MTVAASAAPSANVIMVVDDEEAICETLKDVLEEEGFVVEVASDGVDALAVLRRMPGLPSMMILDVLMPRMDGHELLMTMRADPKLARVPVVISTSDPSRAPAGERIMKKPISLDVLLDTVGGRCVGPA